MWPALVAFLAVAASAGAMALFSSHSHDEDQYAWSAGYFSHLLWSGDFRRSGDDPFLDPGWSAHSYWGRSTGTRGAYALGLVLPFAQAPARPYSYTDPALQDASTRLDRSSLVTLRLVGVLMAAVGAALLAVRLGWIAVAAIVAVLAIPHGAEDFSRAWAEGPLLFGFGLIAAAWGTRFFPFALAIAGTFKLTAIGLWPLLLVRRASPMPRIVGLAATIATWTLLTPLSWHAGGPLHIINLVDSRLGEYSAGQATNGGGLFVPSRYLWPFELALCLALAWLIARRGRGIPPVAREETGPFRARPVRHPHGWVAALSGRSARLGRHERSLGHPLRR